jgi:hypothetical protein
MAVFSGTNLPPILRLGGSLDVIASIPEDTAGIRLMPRCLPSTHVTIRSIELPLSIIGKTDQKGRIKDGGRRRNSQSFSTPVRAK